MNFKTTVLPLDFLVLVQSSSHLFLKLSLKWCIYHCYIGVTTNAISRHECNTIHSIKVVMQSKKLLPISVNSVSKLIIVESVLVNCVATGDGRKREEEKQQNVLPKLTQTSNFVRHFTTKTKLKCVAQQYDY